MLGFKVGQGFSLAKIHAFNLPRTSLGLLDILRNCVALGGLYELRVATVLIWGDVWI